MQITYLSRCWALMTPFCRFRAFGIGISFLGDWIGDIEGCKARIISLHHTCVGHCAEHLYRAFSTEIVIQLYLHHVEMLRSRVWIKSIIGMDKLYYFISSTKLFVLISKVKVHTRINIDPVTCRRMLACYILRELQVRRVMV